MHAEARARSTMVARVTSTEEQHQPTVKIFINLRDCEASLDGSMPGPSDTEARQHTHHVRAARSSERLAVFVYGSADASVYNVDQDDVLIIDDPTLPTGTLTVQTGGGRWCNC